MDLPGGRPEHALDVRLTPDDLVTTMREDVERGLTATPKTLPPKYFYDARGSDLFEEITRLPEYYPTRTERRILEDHADDIARAAAADTLVELGSGSSAKTVLLLDALIGVGGLRQYIPVDVSDAALEGALKSLADVYPTLALSGVVADFERHLDDLPGGDRRLVAFLGSTIGNLDRAERQAFLTRLAGVLTPSDSLLIGTDLVKDARRLVSAYDDSAGVTAEFNRNVLRVLARELGADFDPDAFDHVARWNEREEQMEMWLRAQHRMHVTVPALGLEVAFEPGEEMRTEISVKFRLDGIRDELATAGFATAGEWTDPAADFALTLARPRG